MSIPSLSILTETGEGKSYLAEQYGKVIENIDNGTVGAIFKNQDLSGDPNAGTVKARRFVNATLDDYGTARSGGGKKLKASDTNVDLDKDKECIEQVEDKDARMYGVEGLVQRRLNVQQHAAIKELERDFWSTAVTAGTVLTPSADATTVAEKVDELIVAIETTRNNYVDGVDRDMIGLVLSPVFYTKLQENIDTIANPANGGTYKLFHNVRVFSSTDLPADVGAVALVEGSVAQPVHYTPDEAGKFPASNLYHFGFFVTYGTKAVMPELIRYLTAN